MSQRVSDHTPWRAKRVGDIAWAIENPLFSSGAIFTQEEAEICVAAFALMGRDARSRIRELEEALRGLIAEAHRVADQRMWRYYNGELIWNGATPDGNEIETERPITILNSAVARARALLAEEKP